jgi:hypothetical protein
MEETTEQKEIAVEEMNENEGRRLERAEQNEIIKSYVLFFFTKLNISNIYGQLSTAAMQGIESEKFIAMSPPLFIVE